MLYVELSMFKNTDLFVSIKKNVLVDDTYC